MKISDATKELLKNYATINHSLKVEAGNVIRTISAQKNILAKATVSEKFPTDFAIYDLNQFLGLCSLFEDGEIDFGEKSLSIKEGAAKANYTYTDPSMVKTAPNKEISDVDFEVKFEITKEDIRKILNAANQLNLPDVVVRSVKDSTEVEVVATDTKNSTSNEFVRTFKDAGVDKDAEFKFVFKTENIKFLPKDYAVSIASKGISNFKDKGGVVEYWVATESGSSFNK